MKIKVLFSLAILLGGAPFMVMAQQPSTNDLWDVSGGVTIITNSPIYRYDALDIFGGTFSPVAPESGNVIFNDGNSNEFVHFVEWKTSSPVTVRSFNLWAIGDVGGTPLSREFASFILKAKSPGSNTYDVTVHSFTPSHPYTFVDGIAGLLISTDVRPITAQEFRAEFVNRTGAVYDGPRIVELDGFSEFIGPRPSIRVSQVEICWPSVSNLFYQVEFRSLLTSNQWMAFGSPIVGNGSTNCFVEQVSTPQKFYRVRAVD